MRLLLGTILITALFGCATSPMFAPVVRVNKNKNYELGKKMSTSIGSPIITINRTKEVDVYTPTKTFKPPKAGAFWEGNLRPGMKLHTTRMTKEGDVLITSGGTSNGGIPENLAIRISANGSVSVKNPKYNPRDPSSKKRSNGSRGWMAMYTAAGVNPYTGLPNQVATNSGGSYIKISQDSWPSGQLFRKMKKGHAQKGSFRAELIYSGKVGSNVKATYREYSDNMMRPAFSQELSYNLEESKTIGYKTIKIKVLSATNSNLTYEVMADGDLPWLPVN